MKNIDTNKIIKYKILNNYIKKESSINYSS